MKRLIFIILISILLVMTACSNENETKGTNIKTEENETKDLEIGFKVGNLAFDFEVENSDGELVKLSDFKGKKVLLIAWTST